MRHYADVPFVVQVCFYRIGSVFAYCAVGSHARHGALHGEGSLHLFMGNMTADPLIGIGYRKCLYWGLMAAVLYRMRNINTGD